MSGSKARTVIGIGVVVAAVAAGAAVIALRRARHRPCPSRPSSRSPPRRIR